MPSLSPIAVTVAATEAILKTVLNFWPINAVAKMLFGGPIRSNQKTRFAFKETVDRYKISIKDVNRSLTLIIGLTVIALYAYLVLPPTGEVTIPFVGLKVSRQLWVRIVPAIAYGLQVFAFTAFIWFMLLRLGLRMLLMEKTGAEDDYGDVTNIALEGALGHLWIILRIRHFYRSKWNYFWYLPALAVVSTIFMSPLLLCLFFIRQLFHSGRFDLILGLVYSGLFIPYAAFFVLLVCTAAILGVGENTFQIEDQIAERVGLASKLSPLIQKSEQGDGKNSAEAQS